eukprot:NODE_769_length_4386_cov_0.176155.p3 type:complete len:203 gc:universal NODE_769_length_4386_cov_0.176155:4245-3637(-)
MALLCIEVKFQIALYLELNQLLEIHGFEMAVLQKYRHIWKMLTSTVYNSTNVLDFLHGNFIFGLGYLKCKSHIEDLIECIVLMIHLVTMNSEKIEFCLLLFMGLIELEDTPTRAMIFTLYSIFEISVVEGFYEVTQGLCHYYVKLLAHRHKVIQLKILEMLNLLNINGIHRLALEMSALSRISKFYQSHIFIKDSNVDSAIE